MALPRHLFVMDFEASCDTCHITIAAVDDASRISAPGHRLNTGDEVKYFKTSRDARDGFPMSVGAIEVQEDTDFVVSVIDGDTLMLFRTQEEAQRNINPVQIDKGSGTRTCLRDQSASRTIVSVDSSSRLSIPHHRLCSGAEVKCASGPGEPLRQCGNTMDAKVACFARAVDLHTVLLFSTQEGARDGNLDDALKFDADSGVGSVLKLKRFGVNWVNEIVEFPGVLVDIATMLPVAEFRLLVRPVENPFLPAFTTKLTTITQADVDAAETLDQVLRRLDVWFREHGAEGALPVTCGDWDLGVMLPTECKRKGLDALIPSALRRWCNIKRVYQQTLGVNRAPGMHGMLKTLQLPLDGHHHLGIDDSRNIAKIAQELVKRGSSIEATANKEAKKPGRERDSEEERARKRAARQVRLQERQAVEPRRQRSQDAARADTSASFPVALPESVLNVNAATDADSLSLAYLRHIQLLP